MGFLSSIGSFLGGPGGAVLGGLVDAGLGFIGGQKDRDATAEANANNAALQTTFAQNGIQWKVADAKAAGIHPLYALGSTPFSPTPSYLPASSGDSFRNARTFTDMSQNVSRAAASTQDADKRREKLLLDNASLQNDLLRAQITQIHQATNPAFPGASLMIDGQGQTASRERSTIPDVGFVETEQGGLAPIYSDAVKQRVEDSMLPEIEWYLRNRINPFALVRGPGKPPREGWWWDMALQQYRPPEDAFISIGKKRR